jgi:hypothetical protein
VVVCIWRLINQAVLLADWTTRLWDDAVELCSQAQAIIAESKGLVRQTEAQRTQSAVNRGDRHHARLGRARSC